MTQTDSSTNQQDDALLDGLTDAQRQAVTHVDGPLLIIAAAGSGKTRVITRRVAHLLALGIPAPSILGITFTNKAANEMKQRISALTPRPLRDWGRLDQPWPIICTFHSLCLRILKHYAPQIGLAENFSIYDSGDQSRLIKQAIESLDISSTNFPASAIHSSISNAKNRMINDQDYARTAGDFFSRTVARVYPKYQELLKINNAMDFDDLLTRAANAMRDHPSIRNELQDRFKYILIDEYQDTNHVQYVLAHALAMKHRNLCVVGDPDQSIYAWRGADIQNILDFETDYPDALVVRLEQNYRSTKTILAIADKLIGHNRQRKEKRLWTENPSGEKAIVLLSQSEHDEAARVTEKLRQFSQQHGYSWSQMAIFYRMNSLSRVMEDALRRANVPYQIARGVEFYSRKEIKDVLAYLRTIANPKDEVSLERILNVPTRGIGDASIKLMQAHAVGNGTSLWEVMRIAGQIQGLSSRAVNAIKQFVSLIDSLRNHGTNLLPDGKGRIQSLMEQTLRASGLEGMLIKLDPDKQEQVANVNELISAASEYDLENPEGSLDDYLARVSLVSDADHLRGAGGTVTMMTLHAAKGLEFPVVAIIGLEEGCLPHARAASDPEQMEEERRLCFVGITRARERLILSNAASRMIRGKRENTKASQFLAQLPLEMLEISNETAWPSSYDSNPQQRITQLENERLGGQFHVGQKVRHPKYGVGKIVEISGSSQSTRAVIEFTGAGRKNFILQVARLEPL